MPIARKNKKYLKRLALIPVVFFILLNTIAIFHAYKFTHFETVNASAIKAPESMSSSEKLSALFFGVSIKRPVNSKVPLLPFKTVNIQSNTEIEAWIIPQTTMSLPSKGTVILFHGYGGKKSSMLDYASEFHAMGYQTMLVDFMGSGGSEGNRCTVGYKEAEQVKSCFEYMKNNGESKLYLFGTSMGAVAILKAMSDYNLEAKGIIVECPFGTMQETVEARFKIMNAPAFPMANLLVFWGGLINGFNAFQHNPIEYAKKVHCPTLLLYGADDPKVCRSEIDAIYSNLPANKTLKVYSNTGHENYLIKNSKVWQNDVTEFLKN